MHLVIPQPHALMDHRYNSLFFNPEFKFLLIHESNFHVIGFSYEPNTRDALGRVSHSRQPPTWPPPPPPAGYWPAPPPSGQPSKSSSNPPPPSNQGYWPPPPWAPPARGQAPSWGMPLWTISTSQQPYSSPLTVIYLCLLSIVLFVIRANVKRLAYSSIYIFKRPSSSVVDFTDGVLYIGGSGKGEGSGTDNDAAP
jgi:hypothetical protein